MGILTVRLPPPPPPPKRNSTMAECMWIQVTPKRTLTLIIAGLRPRLRSLTVMLIFIGHKNQHIYAYMASDIWKEGNVLFNDTLNTFYLRLYGTIYNIEETHCHNFMGYNFRLLVRDLLHAPSQRQASTHSLC